MKSSQIQRILWNKNMNKYVVSLSEKIMFICGGVDISHNFQTYEVFLKAQKDAPLTCYCYSNICA